MRLLPRPELESSLQFRSGASAWNGASIWGPNWTAVKIQLLLTTGVRNQSEQSTEWVAAVTNDCGEAPPRGRSFLSHELAKSARHSQSH